MARLSVTHKGGFGVNGVGRLESGERELPDSAWAPFVAHPLVREMVELRERIIWLDKPDDVDAWLKQQQGDAEQAAAPEPVAAKAPSKAKGAKPSASEEAPPPPPSED